jgi:hypothetical protein
MRRGTAITGGHQSAGGHFNPTDKQHGFKSADGPHAGDLPNQYVEGDGILRAEIFSPTLTLAEAETGIFGRALIIHANPDNYESQPAGDAGSSLGRNIPLPASGRRDSFAEQSTIAGWRGRLTHNRTALIGRHMQLRGFLGGPANMPRTPCRVDLNQTSRLTTAVA